MKRLSVRISVLSAVVVLGIMAIAFAQRRDEAPAPDAAQLQKAKELLQQGLAEGSDGASQVPRQLGSGSRATPLFPSQASSEVIPASAVGAPDPSATAAKPADDGRVSVRFSSANTQVSAPNAQSPFDLAANTAAMMAPQGGLVGGPTVGTPMPPAGATAGLAEPAIGSTAAPLATAAAPSAGEEAAGDAISTPFNVMPSEPGAAAMPQNPTDAGSTESMPGTPLPPPDDLANVLPDAADPTMPATGAMVPIGSGPSADSPSGDSTPAISDGLATAMPAPQAGLSLTQGTASPGSPQLEGPRTPQVTIEKIAPTDVQVGKPTIFRVKVQNVGQVEAYGVTVHDQVPRGTRLVSTNPRASQGLQGELVWDLGTLRPGEEVSAEMEVMPVEEGEIGSVATVQFRADAAARAVATKPELVVKTSGPTQVLIGDEMTLSITVTNPGSGVATGVVLEEHVPTGLVHEAGSELQYEVGDLKPNESRELQLQLRADRPGVASNILTAFGDGNLKAEDRLDVEIISPQLRVAVDGASRRFLERQALYTLSISNPGTAPAKNVRLTAELPPGLQFVSANNSGQYDEATRTVQWQLEELPVKETGSVQLVTMPMHPGEQLLRISGRSDRGIADEIEQPLVIEGVAALNFEVIDAEDPIERGGETTYEIRVVNQGSKPASNVQVVAFLAPEMQAVAAEGPSQHVIDATRVAFEPLPRLAPKADTTYRVRVQGLQPGDLRLKVQVASDDIRNPVTKEESTQVYAE